MKKLTRQYEIVNYNFGIFQDIPLVDFIEKTLIDEPEYDLFQVVDGAYWCPGGTVSYRQLILKRK